MRRKIGELSDVAAAGFECGLQRRAPTAEERAMQSTPRLRDAFARGRRRGLARAAVLQQQEMFEGPRA